MKLHLRQIEIQLQTLIEWNAARMFPAAYSEFDLINRMLATLRNEAKTSSDGRSINPNLLILETSLDQAQVFKNNQALIDQLTQALFDHVLNNGGAFDGPLVIRISGFNDVLPGEIRISAYHSQEGLAQTSTLEPDPIDKAGSNSQKAYLVVDGTLVFDIRGKIVNIGRNEDNDLVIDDPRISRRHAQLRLAGNAYVLSDLDSTGGTQVNGERIRQKVLFSGDVISLSGVPLVFSQEARDLEDTQKN